MFGNLVAQHMRVRLSLKSVVDAAFIAALQNNMRFSRTTANATTVAFSASANERLKVCHHESGRYDKSFVVNAIINMDNTGFTLKRV